ncbi:hypothetical protein WR25_03056 [Diploscapter pachys]|uniref:BHLH domain-containing protein n=1 Tax=Diploscapter pachys TaxID=2018661 RepID=A0A2A2KBL8_9BILA|nr:hypothetical protein WR25_03056 [Diploscapter pachys]
MRGVLYLTKCEEYQERRIRSTRGASKQRRDQINIEIQRLRDLLPLSDSIKDRLFQLQVMSLGCIYIRKHRYQCHLIKSLYDICGPPTPKGIDVCKTLRGFMVMMTRQGKMLHVSENASEYLGHSVEEIMCQGDSIYDLVDPRDAAAVRAELASGPPPSGSFPDERVFICRLNLARTAKRQLQYHKFILLQGRYIESAEYYQNFINSPETAQPVFAAFCQPLINPENAETMANGNTNVFTSQHYLDMKFKELDSMCCEHLGVRPGQLEGTSWYQLLHPYHIQEVAYKHRLLCQEKEGSVLALIRLQNAAGEWIWLHTVFAIRGNFTHETQDGRRVRHIIQCYYQILSELEAATLQANAWIYTMRHTYPAAFSSQDSPESDDRPLSPASPYPSEPFVAPTCDSIFPNIKTEPPFMPLIHPQFLMNCNQIEVEIPMKPVLPAHLSLFTPESSSPESASSLNSLLLSNASFIAQQEAPPPVANSLLDKLLPATNTETTLPELKDELDEFFREVEQSPTSSSAASSSTQPQNPLPSNQPPDIKPIVGPFPPGTLFEYSSFTPKKIHESQNYCSDDSSPARIAFWI